MTLQTPLDLEGEDYSARDDRQLIGDIFNQGVRGADDLAVTSNGGVLSVSVAAGAAYVAGTSSSDQGTYRVFNDAPVVVTFDAAATYPRLDQIIVLIHDTVEGDADNTPSLAIRKGVESSGATLANRTGAVGLPANCLRLADILVPPGAGPVIPSGNINDRRTRAAFNGPGAVPIGSQMPYAGSVDPSDPSWLICDGRLLDRNTYAVLYSRIAHTYNGGVDPGSNKFRIPDKRGRTSIGALSMGSGSPGVSNSRANVVRGANGGEAAHTLTTAELAAHDHGATGSENSSLSHSHAGTTSIEATSLAHSHPPYAGAGIGVSFVDTNAATVDNLAVQGGAAGIAAQAHGGGGNFGNNPTTGADGPPAHVHTFTSSAAGPSAHTHNTASAGSGGGHNNLSPYETDTWIVRVA